MHSEKQCLHLTLTILQPETGFQAISVHSTNTKQDNHTPTHNLLLNELSIYGNTLMLARRPGHEVAIQYV
jgi:hypothetical protein